MFYNSMGEKIISHSLIGNSFLDVYLAGITYPNPAYHIFHNISRNHLWDKYVFEYVIEGKGHIETEDRTLTVRKGDMYFLNKLRRHVYYADKQEPYCKLFVVMTGSFVDALVSAFNITESVIINRNDIRPVLEDIHRLVQEKDFPYQRIEIDILKLFQALGKDCERAPFTADLASIVKSYLDSNLTEKITLDSISDYLHISKSHIERLFKERYGVTPLRYFSDRKINYACTLLINSEYSVSEIADYLTLCDAKYLSKCIKKRTGMSPLQYRKAKKLENKNKS